MSHSNSICGLDFGTSNSTIAISIHNQPKLIPLDGEKATIRSAIFCNAELKEWTFGQEGITQYLESYPGRLMVSLKSVLGSPFMEDKTLIFDEYISYATVLGRFIKHIKNTAEKNINQELKKVVMGRPVYFHDHDPVKDKLAQNTLEKIAKEVGFSEVLFQYEPIAAALTYETSIQKEQLALIVDIGGGTSDFTVIRLHPNIKTPDRSQDVLANLGIHVAGTDFDQRLSIKKVMPYLGMGSAIRGSSCDLEMPSMYYHDLTTWHTLGNLYSQTNITQVKSIQTVAYQKDLIERLLTVLKYRAGHKILDQVEKCKQLLSGHESAEINLEFIEKNLLTPIMRAEFDVTIENDLEKILATIEETIQLAKVKHADINAIFYTGGSTKIPIIRKKINALFPTAIVIEGDAFGSVGLGLAIDAERRFSKK